MWWELGVVGLATCVAAVVSARHVYRMLTPRGGCACMAPCGDVSRLKRRTTSHATR